LGRIKFTEDPELQSISSKKEIQTGTFSIIQGLILTVIMELLAHFLEAPTASGTSATPTVT